MIILYGYLRKKFGKSINSDVHSVEELMKAAEANRPGFRSHIEKDRKYIIRRGDSFKQGYDISKDELNMSFNDKTWHILPLPYGHKGGPFQILAGVVLIVVGYVVPVLAPYLYPLGASLILGGVSSMLAPSLNINDYSDRDKSDERASYLFDGPVNRTAAGGSVPIVYGKDVFIGSIFISGGIHIGDLSTDGPEGDGKWDNLFN